jgi:hypothetical protein
VGVGVGVGVDVGAAVGAAVGADVGATLGVEAGAGVALGVAVGDGTAVGVGVALGVAVALGFGVGVDDGVTRGLADGAGKVGLLLLPPPPPQAVRPSARLAASKVRTCIRRAQRRDSCISSLYVQMKGTSKNTADRIARHRRPAERRRRRAPDLERTIAYASRWREERT